MHDSMLALSILGRISHKSSSSDRYAATLLGWVAVKELKLSYHVGYTQQLNAINTVSPIW